MTKDQELRLKACEIAAKAMEGRVYADGNTKVVLTAIADYIVKYVQTGVSK